MSARHVSAQQFDNAGEADLVTRRRGREWTEERRQLYVQLLDERLDADALHQLLVDKGTDLLDASVPYLVVAARNRARSTARRERRRADLESAATSQTRPSVFDPADIVAARQELSAVIVELGRLDPAYSWPLWWHAGGFSDDDIVELWNDAGFEPRNPSPAAIRKRRQRARSDLRSRLTRSLGHPPST